VSGLWTQGNEVPEHVGILQYFQHFVNGIVLYCLINSLTH
jgi:hypothetical protein